MALPGIIEQPRGAFRTWRQTRSWTCVRLFLLGERMPRRVHGTIRFPFGEVGFVDAAVMLSSYKEIFLDHVYEVAGLRDVPYIIDCGGNIGLSTIWFKQRYPKARITVFEADPAIADVLDHNVRSVGLNSVEVVKAAVSGEAGYLTFTSEGSLGGHVSNDEAHGIKVEAIRLSERISEPVDLLKVDIEGSEFNLLRDLCTTRKIDFVQHLICEIHGNSQVQNNVPELWTLLSEAGFRLTMNEARVDALLPGPADPTPFPTAVSGKFLLWIYAWRP